MVFRLKSGGRWPQTLTLNIIAGRSDGEFFEG